MWHESLELLIAGLGSAIAIVIAVFAIIQASSSKVQAESARTQTNILKTEFEANHRPWVGAKEIGFIDGHSKLEKIFQYKNYGVLPALSLIERYYISEQLIELDNIDREKMTEYKESVLFPTQERKFSFFFTEKQVRKLNEQQVQSLFVYIIIEYDFSNGKHGEYGVIAEFLVDGSIYIRKEIGR